MKITAKQLKQFPIFSNFKKREIEDIIKNSFTKTLEENEYLFKKGDKRDTFFIILEGNISIVRDLGDASEIVDIVTKGEYIAEHALFNPKSEHKHSAYSYYGTSKVLCISGKVFKNINTETKYKLILNLLPIISDNFSHASNRILALSQIGYALGKNSTDVGEIGDEILKILLQAIKANKAIITLLLPNRNKIKIISTLGFNKKNDIKNKIINLKDDGILKQSVTSKDVISLSKADYLSLEKKEEYIESCVLSVPLIIEGNIIGSILLIDKKGSNRFSMNNEVLLSIVSQMVALKIYQTKQNYIKEAEQELKREYVSL